MSQTEKLNQRLNEMRKKMILSLAINGLVPVALYALVRPLVANDAVALTLAGTVPAMRTLVVLIARRRVEWIGALAVLGFVIALTISMFMNGDPFLLKVHGSLLIGTIGFVLLVSAFIGKPLLLPLLQAFGHNNIELSNTQTKVTNQPGRYNRISLVTVLVGLALLIDAAVHIIMAILLPTSEFLALSRMVNWAILGGGLAIIWLTRQRVGRFGR